MFKKKLPLCVFAVANLCMLVSCGSKISHDLNCNIHHYCADLDHNGTLSDKEKNLTWKEAYDTLVSQTNSFSELEAYADAMNISKDDATKPYRTALARYEILHQIEELLMGTGAMMPFYNYEDSFMIKEYITGGEKNPHGMYSSSLGYKFFERLLNNGKKGGSYRICVGSKAQTMDPTKNSTVEAATMLSQCLMGVKRWVPVGTKEKPFAAGLDDGICTSSKVVDIATGCATWTITIKPNVKWEDGTNVTSDDFIWAWNRAAHSSSGTSFSSMFDCVEGYSIPDPTYPKDTSKNTGWHYKKKVTPFDYYNGLSGLKKVSEQTFKVKLVNDCAYFEELLAFPSFMPLPRHTMVDNIHTENETIDDSWWKGTSTSKTDLGKYFCANGPLKFSSIDNKEGGSITCVPNDNYIYKDEVTVGSVKFALIDDDSAMLTQYKDGSLQFIDSVAAGSTDDMKAKYPKEFKFADQTALYYYLFNVNDNTFDLDINKGLSQSDQETKREKLRWVMNLLINRNDICTNVGKSGQTPSSGFVSDGIVENVLPIKVAAGELIPNGNGARCTPTKSGANYAWCISLDDKGKPNTLDWQKRNRPFSGFTQFKTWGKGKNTNEYNVFEDRTEPTRTSDDQLLEGFFPTFSGKNLSGEEIDPKGTVYANAVKNAQTQYINAAVELAKEAGVHVIGNSPETYRFIDFPQVKLTMNTGTGHEQVAEKLQYYYGLFGIKLTVETQEWNSFCSAKRKGNFALARNGWTADYRDPRTYLDVCCSENDNNDCQFGKTQENGAFIHASK